MDTEHHLLFGVLALQCDLINASQFAEACTLWASRTAETSSPAATRIAGAVFLPHLPPTIPYGVAR